MFLFFANSAASSGEISPLFDSPSVSRIITLDFMVW
jgi:hypothetical protein